MGINDWGYGEWQVEAEVEVKWSNAKHQTPDNWDDFPVIMPLRPPFTKPLRIRKRRADALRLPDRVPGSLGSAALRCLGCAVWTFVQTLKLPVCGWLLAIGL